MFAVINVHKPLHLTSHDVIARLRRVYKIKKVGHMGTLDPLAEGVLPVCLGVATRLIEYFPENKRYLAKVCLGKTTTTLDSAGEETSLSDCSHIQLTHESVDQLLEQFRGTITQEVPLYSAVHVDGKKLYQLAYAGKTATLPSREVTIYTLALVKIDLSNPAQPKLVLDVSCSSGTYIRSLARDIGAQLGVGAHLSGLTRTQHGLFNLENAIPLANIQSSETPEIFLQNPLPFVNLPTIHLPNPELALKFRHGLKVKPDEINERQSPEIDLNEWEEEKVYLASLAAEPIGVIKYSNGLLKPVKIFPPELVR